MSCYEIGTINLVYGVVLGFLAGLAIGLVVWESRSSASREKSPENGQGESQ